MFGSQNCGSKKIICTKKQIPIKSYVKEILYSVKFCLQMKFGSEDKFRSKNFRSRNFGSKIFEEKQAQICAEGCEEENFTHIDTEKELIYSLMVNILQILSKCCLI